MWSVEPVSGKSWIVTQGIKNWRNKHTKSMPLVSDQVEFDKTVVFMWYRAQAKQSEWDNSILAWNIFSDY